MDALKLLPEAKKWLWAISDASDDEYVQVINACVFDLQNAGVGDVDLEDPLIKQAVKLYLKAQAGYEEGAEHFNVAYEHIKNALAISYRYREVDEE